MMQTAGGRRQEADGRRQTAGGRRQEADGRRQTAGGRRQEAGAGADGRQQEQEAGKGAERYSKSPRTLNPKSEYARKISSKTSLTRKEQ
jgi:hypothetical protein